MLRTIIAKGTHSMTACRRQYPAATLTAAKFLARSRSIPSAFTDRRELALTAPRRQFHSSPLIFSATPTVNLDDEIRIAILEKGETYPPPKATDEKLPETYKKSAKGLIEKVRTQLLDSRFFLDKKAHLQPACKASLETNFLPIFHRIANADKVMIFCGRNTAEGKLTVESPVSAAIAAYALYKCHKVAIIVSDEPNKRLIQLLLTELDKKCGKFITYLPINQVNGTLLSTLSRQIACRKPDVTLYIDIPGRNKDGDYLDEMGRSIALSNVAFDQALNLQNAQGAEAIAICSGINSAGYPADEAVADKVLADISQKNDETRSAVSASHSLVLPDVVAGTLSLMELVSAACTDMEVCSTAQVQTLLSMAAEKTEEKALQAPVLRKMSKPRPPWQPGVPDRVTEDHPTLQFLKSLHGVIDASHVMWPASVEKIKAYGPDIRHVTMFDSSDGVLIGTEDFIGYMRARSNFHVKVNAVADHARSPYGRYLSDDLFTIVVNGIAFCASLQGDAIVMVCNTACTVGLARVKVVVEKWLAEMGMHYKVEIIDLIETVAAAILDEGGPHPVLLATQATAESHAYPRAVEALAEETGRVAPPITVIGCGNRNISPPDDWATFVNIGAHDPSHPEHNAFLFAMKTYAYQIPLNATSIWLCCTHFPVLEPFIRQFLNERLEANNMPRDSIHIFNTLAYQADATIAHLDRAKTLKGKDYAALHDLEVLTTGWRGDVSKSVARYFDKTSPPLVFQVAFPQVPLGQGSATPLN